MKKSIALILLPALLICFTCLSGCKGRTEKKEQQKQELVQKEQVETDIEKNVYPLPSSAEVIRMLSDSEVSYIFGITNPVANSKKYFTSSQRAINMGVFGADLSYCTLYKMQQEVINYLDAIQSLANELNMSKIYDETLYDKIKANFDIKDTLVVILTNAFDKTYGYLDKNGQKNLALLVVGGAWVEGMFLTTHVSDAAFQAAGFSKNLIDQKKSFDTYLEITKDFMNDPLVSDFVNKLEPIKEVYKGLTTSLTMQNIKDIGKAITTVREQIVQ